MVFSSLIFVFGFLPLFLAAYYLTPQRFKNITALAGSYLFYAWGAPGFVFVLVATAFIDYSISKAFYHQRVTAKKRKMLLILSLLMNLGLLGYFKYSNFFVQQINTALSLFGINSIPWSTVVLPIGISFFTFQEMSYILDVYWRNVKPARAFTDFAMYLVLFPQLIAGPIVRYIDVAQQVRHRSHTADKMFQGIYRFSVGLGKKVLIANTLGEVADTVFGLSFHSLSTPYAWVGILCYTFQIYFDFSGYSDMAIGLGKMIGFDYMENFNLPYISQNFTEFWRRWHISLSTWMREYVYIPLGGNRVKRSRMYMNLAITFLLSGFWHGAGWSFVVWGAYHGCFIIFDKIFWSRASQKLPRAVNVFLTFFFINVSWVFFRSNTLVDAGRYLSIMFGWVGNRLIWTQIMSLHAVTILCIAAVICFAPLLAIRPIRVNARAKTVAQGAISFSLFLLSVASLANNNFNPFIYFRF